MSRTVSADPRDPATVENRTNTAVRTCGSVRNSAAVYSAAAQARPCSVDVRPRESTRVTEAGSGTRDLMTVKELLHEFPRRMADSAWQQRVGALGRGGCVRYDESTATRLAKGARLLM